VLIRKQRQAVRDMSKAVGSQERKKGKDLLDSKGDRLSPGALDGYYIEAYMDNPKLSQHDVLKLAMINAEHPGNATRQHAYQIHDRNRDKINTAMVKVASDLKNLSISVIKDLMLNSDSDSVKLSAAQTGTKDLFPNVSVKKTQTIDDLNDDISRLLKETAEAEGKTVDQVMKELIH